MRKIRVFGFGAASALATLSLTGGAVAQEASNEIVVTGYRVQNREAVEAKRGAEQIAEFLSTDVIGQLPDYNISDSFRRLPGVQTVFDEDEGRYVSIRGLNPNFTFGSFNQSTIATAERQNRQLNLEAIPTTAVKRLEVYKTRTPDLEGAAIGGSINLVSRSAFDEDGLFYTAQVFIGASDSRDVPGEGFNRDSDDGLNYRFDGALSYVFGKNDQFGVLLTGAYSRKRRDQERQLPQAFTTNASTFNVPVSDFRTSSYPNSVDRYGGMLKLEWRPTQNVATEVSLLHYVQDDNELRFNQDLTLPARSGVTNYTLAGNNALNVASAGGFVLFNDFPIEKPLTIAQGGFDWSLTDAQKLSGRVAYSEAEFNEASQEVRFDLPNSTTNAGVYRLIDGVPQYTFNTPATATYLNSGAYTFASYRPYEDDSDDFIREAQLDYGFNTERTDEGLGVQVGVKWRENERDFDTRRNEICGGATANVTACPARGLLTLNQALGRTGYTSPYGVSDQLIIDFKQFQRYFLANRGQFSTDGVLAARNERVNDYVVTETVAAAYGLGRYKTDALTIIAGGRFEQTETDVAGFRVVGTTGIDIRRLNRSGDYTNFLPSVNVIYDLSSDIKVRGAFYQAIGRPNPSDLGTNESLNQGAGTVSRGNPDLQARESDNYDLSLEWYLPKNQGVVSIGLFRKEISNDIFSAAAGTTVNDGVTYSVTQPQNLRSSEVQGLELQIVKNNLDFLPGFLSNFGVSANYTLIDAESILPNGAKFGRLPGQAEQLANFALFYEQGPFQARATYAYTGDYFTVIGVNPADNRFDRALNQLDLQSRVDFGRFELIGEVRNFTDENRVNYQTTAFGNAARDLNFYGRQFWLGVAYKP